MYDFNLICCDTDSITICKKNETAFTDQEISKLTNELNSLFEEGIKWEYEFNLPKMIVLKAKNYVLYDGKTIKTKGSALKATTKEPALREFIQETIKELIYETYQFTNLYNRYVSEILNVRDISRWSSKKTITDKVLNAQRTNEQKVKDIIEGTEISEGDKIRVYFKPDGTLSLQENFDGNYCKKRLLKKLFDTAQVFDSVLPVDDLYKNYSLKRNEKELQSFE